MAVMAGHLAFFIDDANQDSWSFHRRHTISSG
jgi:hypothetical protein